MKEAAIESTGIEGVALASTAISGLLLSGGVIACFVYLLLAVASVVTLLPVFAQNAPVAAGVRLQAGIEKEDVDGDLKSAMDIYQKIAADTLAPRDVRARALLRLAGCDEKLGRQARQVYEQIVHDYADMPAAAQARKRLASLKQLEHPALPATMSVRKIEWAGLGEMGNESTDGQRAAYMTPGGSIYFGDLAGRKRSLIFKDDPDSPNGTGWIASRDFSIVALALDDKLSHIASVAVVKIDGTGYRELLRDDAQGSVLGGDNLFLMEWSWDNRNLLIPIYSQETRSSRLWLVYVADGQHRVLVSTEGYIQKAVFSPDGHYVAYAVLPKDRKPLGTSRIFVLPTAGGEPRLVFETSPGAFEVGPTGSETRFNPLKDWTADGRFLAVKDVRQGKSALYLLPMKDGVATGPEEFVRYGEFDEASITASGAMVYSELATRPMQVPAFLASLDPGGHLGSWKQLALRSRLDHGISPYPSFSPDGRQIAYLAGDADPARKDIVLQDITTGTERVLYRSASKGLLRCEFSTITPKLFCTESTGAGANGKSELFSIAADSGSVERIADFRESRIILQSPQDDKIFYFATSGTTLQPIVRWDRSTQAETLLSALSDNFHVVAPSVDGRWFMRTLNNGTLQIQSTSGGDWRTLASGLTEAMATEATPDGNWVLYHSTDPAGKVSLFRVSVDGGEPQRLGDFPIHEAWGVTVRISPDGSRFFAAESEDTHYDLWVLENFEPSVRQ